MNRFKFPFVSRFLLFGCIYVLLGIVLGAFLYYSAQMKEVLEISNAMNDKSIISVFQKYGVKEVTRYGEPSFTGSSNKLMVVTDSSGVTCEGRFLPYNYRIIFKDGKLVYFGDDLIKNNVPFSSMVEEIDRIENCLKERQIQLNKEKKNRDSWKN